MSNPCLFKLCDQPVYRLWITEPQFEVSVCRMWWRVVAPFVANCFMWVRPLPLQEITSRRQSADDC